MLADVVDAAVEKRVSSSDLPKRPSSLSSSRADSLGGSRTSWYKKHVSFGVVAEEENATMQSKGTTQRQEVNEETAPESPDQDKSLNESSSNVDGLASTLATLPVRKDEDNGLGGFEPPRHILAATVAARRPSSVLPPAACSIFVRGGKGIQTLYDERQGLGTASTRTCSPKSGFTSSPSTPSLFSPGRPGALDRLESPVSPQGPGSPKTMVRSPSSKALASPASTSASPKSGLFKNLAKTVFTAVKAKRGTLEGMGDGAEDPVNVMFKSPIIRNDPLMHQFLWSEIKKRMIQTFGSLERSFRVADTSNDGCINYLEFNDLLSRINLQLDARFARNLFNQASGKDRELSFQEFKSTVMEGTLKKLKSTLRRVETNRDKIKSNIESFLYALTHGDMKNRQNSVDRFQRKLSLNFCSAFWDYLRKVCTKRREREVECNMFLESMQSAQCSGSTFQMYEFDIIENIFKRIDRSKTGKVHVLDLTTCLVLMSGETDPKKKMKLIFEVFDQDDDKCLTHHQVLLLFCSICLHRPLIIGDAGVAEADIVFNDELGLQQGKRFFELTLQHLSLKNSRQQNVTKDIVCFEELWMVFNDRPEALEALMPGTHNLQWAMSMNPNTERPISRDLQKSRSKNFESSARGVLAASHLKKMNSTNFKSNPSSPLATAFLQSQGATVPLFGRPTTSEQYVAGTKRGFRQALRGDWPAVRDRNTKLLDHVKALHEARPNSRGQYGKEWKKTIPEEVLDEDATAKMQGEDWSQKHRNSIIQWVVETEQFEGHLPMELTKSRSEPALPSAARAKQTSLSKSQRPATQQKSKEQAQSHREKHRKSTADNLADVTELPPIPSLCWGNESFPRFQKYSAAQLQRYHAQLRRTDRVNYKCQLCWSDHELKSTCDM